jgi:hypothetical protein
MVQGLLKERGGSPRVVSAASPHKQRMQEYLLQTKAAKLDLQVLHYMKKRIKPYSLQTSTK